MIVRECETYLNQQRIPVVEMTEKVCDLDYDTLNETSVIAEFMTKMYRLDVLTEENVYLLAFDAKCHLLAVFHLARGSVNSAFCRPREIYLKALSVGATLIVLVHNHPSGDCEPSVEDLYAYSQAKEVGELIGIDLVDFLVIGKDSYYSMNEKGV